MKTPDHEQKPRLDGTEKPGFQRLWIATVVSGTCVAAHDSAATWMTVVNGLTIKGSFLGNRVDLAEVIELHAAGRTRVESETRKLEEVNEAFDEVDSGEVRARIVFDLR